MDEVLRKLQREAASGDPEALAKFYAARVRTCAHDGGYFLANRELSLWGHGERWCLDCGYCLSNNDSLEPRPQLAEQNRLFNEQMNKALEAMDTWGPKDWEKFSKDLDQELKNQPELFG